MKFLAVFATLAVLIIFPIFIFWMLVRAVRDTGTRWWGIIILLSILTCYCTTFTGGIGLVAGGGATGTAAMEQHYCEHFREILTQTETLPEALTRMDKAAAADEYQVKEPDKNLRFRFVWLLGGCFLFAGANLMMFAPGRRERRHPTDCMVTIVAALIVFLTGIWQIAWGNGYAYQAGAYRRMLTDWHTTIKLDAIHEPNAEIAAKLADGKTKSLNGLWALFRKLSGENDPFSPLKEQDAGISGGEDSSADGSDVVEADGTGESPAEVPAEQAS